MFLVLAILLASVISSFVLGIIWGSLVRVRISCIPIYPILKWKYMRDAVAKLNQVDTELGLFFLV